MVELQARQLWTEALLRPICLWPDSLMGKLRLKEDKAVHSRAEQTPAVWTGKGAWEPKFIYPWASDYMGPPHTPTSQD